MACEESYCRGVKLYASRLIYCMRVGNSVRVEGGVRGTGRWVGHSYVVQVLTDLPFVAFCE